MTTPQDANPPRAAAQITDALGVQGSPGNPERIWSDHLERQYAMFRDYAKHEDDLINHRATWHATWQGLLFTALGIVIHWTPGNDDYDPVLKALRVVLPFTGVVVALAGCTLIRAAIQAIQNLSNDWDQRSKDAYPIDKLLPLLPPLTGGGTLKPKDWGRMNLLVPYVAGVVWLIVGAVAALHWNVKQSSTPETVVIKNLSDIAGQQQGAKGLNERLATIEQQLQRLDKQPGATTSIHGRSHTSKSSSNAAPQ